MKAPFGNYCTSYDRTHKLDRLFSSMIWPEEDFLGMISLVVGFPVDSYLIGDMGMLNRKPSFEECRNYRIPHISEQVGLNYELTDLHEPTAVRKTIASRPLPDVVAVFSPHWPNLHLCEQMDLKELFRRIPT